MLKKLIKVFLTVTVLVTINNTNLLIAMEAASDHSVQPKEIRKCGACFEPLKQDDIEFPCSHGMCKESCYNSWVNSCIQRKVNVTCPICRFVLIERAPQQQVNPIAESLRQNIHELLTQHLEVIGRELQRLEQIIQEGRRFEELEEQERQRQESHRRLRRYPILKSALQEHAITVHKKAIIAQISTFALPTISALIGSYIAKKWITTSLGLLTTTLTSIAAGTAGVYLPSLFYLSWHKRTANTLADDYPELRACAQALSRACEESKTALFDPSDTVNGGMPLLNAAITLVDKCGVINRHVNKSSQIIANILRQLS